MNQVLAFETREHSGENARTLKNANRGEPKIRKRILAFDIDQTLNIAKTPIPPEMAAVLSACLDHFCICPISGQKFEQFLIQIVDPIVACAKREGITMLDEGHKTRASAPERSETSGVSPSLLVKRLENLHLFVAQGTQYYRYQSQGDTYNPDNWQQIYNYPLQEEDVVKITTTLQQAAEELGFWEADKLAEGDEIIENRLSQVTFSALGQKAGTEAKYAWDPDLKKRQAIVAKCREKLPDFLYEIGGTTSINVAAPGMNKEFGMTHLLEELHVEKSDVLYFGDMTQPGGNDYPVVAMGIDTITVRSHEDTLYALRGILGVI